MRGRQGSAAEAAGLRQGDELLALDGARVSSQSPYQVAAPLSRPKVKRLRESKPGTTAHYRVDRAREGE